MNALSFSSATNLFPATPQEASFSDRLADSVARQDRESRHYFLSDKMSPGLDYDDRIHQRLRLSKNTIKKYVETGLLRARKLEGKIIISEQAVQRFVNPTYCIESLPGLTGKVNTGELSKVATLHLPTYALRLAAEEDLCRRAHELVAEHPELADELYFLVRNELLRRAKQLNILA